MHKKNGKTSATKSDVRDTKTPMVVLRTNKYLNTIALLIMLVIVSIAGWRSINYVSGIRPGTDSGVFSSSGFHMIQGKVLYKDIWDHKPPMVHFLNSFALKTGDRSINSVRNMERVFAVCGAICLFFIFQILFANKLLAFLMSILFTLSFYMHVFQQGNLTEEYGAFFVLFGVFFAVLSQQSEAKKSVAFAAMSGIFFAMAFFTKEPFLFSAIPWFLYILVKKQQSWRQRLTRNGFFVIGAMVPLTLILIYLIANGALKDWIDVIVYNLHYSSGVDHRTTPFITRVRENMTYMQKYIFNTSMTAMFCFNAGIVSIFCFSFQKKYKYFPLIAVIAFIAEYFATIISPRKYGHYYMQPIVSYILTGGCGVALLLYLFENVKAWKPGVIIGLLLSFFVLDSYTCKHYIKRLKKPSVQANIDPISHYIRKNTSEDDRIWINSGHLSRYYLNTGRLSPTKFSYPFPHFFKDSLYSTAEEKIALLKRELQNKPPKFIVSEYSFMDFMTHNNITEWINNNYVKVASTGTKSSEKDTRIELYLHRSYTNDKQAN
ncbi:MAG: ArnT family glycosyltransferase [Planctomycetota bacterium]|jgi:hypothetical protein